MSHERKLFEKEDFSRLSILVVLALVLGVYQMCTTVMISKDGVYYIERAQKLADGLVDNTKNPLGYPFLILCAHKVLSLLMTDTSHQTWIYAGQSVTLLCRLLALVPLYYMGKLLVSSKNSFWAVLILVLLPSGAGFVCDVVREWPYLLFLAIDFFFLLWGVKYKKWWAFGLVGVSAGLGCLIRHESVQFLIYGLLWILLSAFRPTLWEVSRLKKNLALVFLLIGFSIPAIPYMKYTNRIVAPKIKRLMKTVTIDANPVEIGDSRVDAGLLNQPFQMAEMAPMTVLESLGESFKSLGENLIWFFVPALFVGLCSRFREWVWSGELVLVASFIFLNLIMVTLRYCCIQPVVSQRWILPIVTFTIFYIPLGLRAIGNWLDQKSYLFKRKSEAREGRFSWFGVLMIIGIGICVVKLLGSSRAEKAGYLDAAQWLYVHTQQTDVISVPDKRFSFYAEREGLVYRKKLPRRSDYIVWIVRDGDELSAIAQHADEVYSVWSDKKKTRKIVIYKAF